MNNEYLDQQGVNSRILVLETMTLTIDLVQDLMTQIDKIDSFTSEHTLLLNQQLIDLTASITQFTEMTTLMTRAFKIDSTTIANIKNSHIHLLFVLKGLIQANAKADLIVLEDLIKHELKDNLTQWKITFLPTIRKQISI